VGTGAQEPALAIEGLERHYGDRIALAGVTLSLPVGATLAVFGANGAGKTTLLRVLATLLRPHGGSVTALDASLPDDAWRLRGRVGYLAHEALLYRDLTPRENLLLHARLHGLPAARVDELIAQVGLARRAGDRVRDLSRGMVQRVAAARAVIHDPPLLLLDEPRAGLDPGAAARLEPLIGRESGRTRVLVTHDVDAGLAECDLALGLKLGRQVFCGRATADEVRELYR